MISTAKYLITETNANVAYTQSDEITLGWNITNPDSEFLFNGKTFKLLSTLSAITSVFFNKKLKNYIPEKSHLMPTFDCRIFNVPNTQELVNAVYWRELDAIKNSITMAARCYYSDADLFKKNSSDKLEMLLYKGVDWNDFPTYFKRGTYILRKKVSSKFSDADLNNLPLKHNARKFPDLEIERWERNIVDLPPLSQIKNKAHNHLLMHNKLLLIL